MYLGNVVQHWRRQVQSATVPNALDHRVEHRDRLSSVGGEVEVFVRVEVGLGVRSVLV